MVPKFLHGPAGSGILLGMAALLAIIIANSPLSILYDKLISTPVVVQIGGLKIAKPLLLWVNDGLMAVFFFIVGLELKRECIEGELSELSKIIMPAIGAIGGMVVPAIIYLSINYQDPSAINGWAIPAATDIAFALGVLALVGSRLPVSLKIFLTSLAVFDDIGAIIIIAIFYTSKIDMASLLIAAACIGALSLINRKGVVKKSPYIFIGLIMWIALLKSGVHATLGGVILALFIPMTPHKTNSDRSPLKDFENDLHTSVVYFILPIFAFCNSGLSFAGMTRESVLHPVPIGIALGLFIGKQVGVFGFCWLAIKCKLTQLPTGMTIRHLYGVAALTGIGFTMSLFIGSLAFHQAGMVQSFDERLGIIVGSICSGLLGYWVLKSTLPKNHESKS